MALMSDATTPFTVDCAAVVNGVHKDQQTTEKQVVATFALMRGKSSEPAFGLLSQAFFHPFAL